MTFGLAFPVLMLITDRRLAGGEDALVDDVVETVSGGVNVVQLREKELATAELLHLAIRIREAVSGRAELIVNGSLEVALAAGSDGVHLPEAAAMVERPERPFVVGRSVHSREAAERVSAECSDYLLAGPVYETASHPGMPASGLELIESITAAVAIPVVAVGGITPQQVQEVMRAGAGGVAVVSAMLGSQRPKAAARELRDAVDAAWSRTESMGL
jgi:thiamine-phosphate pyrophosphorylase